MRKDVMSEQNVLNMVKAPLKKLKICSFILSAVSHAPKVTILNDHAICFRTFGNLKISFLPIHHTLQNLKFPNFCFMALR